METEYKSLLDPVTAADRASERFLVESLARLFPEDGFVGMTGFGASAPAPALYEHFGITPAAVADLARKLAA